MTEMTSFEFELHVAHLYYNMGVGCSYIVVRHPPFDRTFALTCGPTCYTNSSRLNHFPVSPIPSFHWPARVSSPPPPWARPPTTQPLVPHPLPPTGHLLLHIVTLGPHVLAVMCAALCLETSRPSAGSPKTTSLLPIGDDDLLKI